VGGVGVFIHFASWKTSKPEKREDQQIFQIVPRRFRPINKSSESGGVEIKKRWEQDKEGERLKRRQSLPPLVLGELQCGVVKASSERKRVKGFCLQQQLPTQTGKRISKNLVYSGQLRSIDWGPSLRGEEGPMCVQPTSKREEDWGWMCNHANITFRWIGKSVKKKHELYDRKATKREGGLSVSS